MLGGNFSRGFSSREIPRAELRGRFYDLRLNRPGRFKTKTQHGSKRTLKGKDTKTSEKGLEPIYDKFGNLANPKPLNSNLSFKY